MARVKVVAILQGWNPPQKSCRQYQIGNCHNLKRPVYDFSAKTQSWAFITKIGLHANFNQTSDGFFDQDNKAKED